VAETIGAKFVAAVAAQDSRALAVCFVERAQLQALIPPGLRERTGAAEAAELIASWFADATELELVDSRIEMVEDRLHVWYRFAVVEEGQPYLVEQHLFCVVADGKIERANLLCSGFRPRLAATAPR
jgi:ketosteroid isomerase-like protein